MNRDDLLKRCVDRRVAHETSVVAVSHLFYVYLLSALKKGQRVEVPNFGTFGTHVVGVKRQRRMPYFEVENDLADKVNERYRTLKAMIVGKVEVTPVEGEVEYAGTMPPYDARSETLGREVVLDTYSELTPEDMQIKSETPAAPPPTATQRLKPVAPVSVPPPEIPAKPAQETEALVPPKERKLMPKLNLRGEGTEGETTPTPETEPMAPAEAPPTLRELEEDTGPSFVRQLLIVLVLIGLATFALNYFGIVRFWGGKPSTPATEEALPPPQQMPQVQEDIKSPETTQEQGAAMQETPQVQEPAPVEQQPQQQAQQPPAEEPKPAEPKPAEPKAAEPKAAEPKPAQPKPVTPSSTGVPAGTGQFTIQVSSWPTRARADRVVNQLAAQGFDAYVVAGTVKGKTWYRVRVGRYATAAEAQAAASRISGNGVWVTRFE